MFISYTIKQVTEDDIDRFYTFFQKSITSQFPEYTEKTRLYFLHKDYPIDKIRELVNNHSRYIYIAIDTDTVVGYLIGYTAYGGVGLCEWIGVANEYKKQGIGSLLLQTYEKQIVEDGGHIVRLVSKDQNVPFYKKNGYIVVGKIPDNYFGADDCILYKPLRKSEEKNYLRDFLR